MPSALVSSVLSASEKKKGWKTHQTGITYDDFRSLVGRSFAGTNQTPGDPCTGWILDPLKLETGSKEREELLRFILGIVTLQTLWSGKGAIWGIEQNEQLKAALLIHEYDSPPSLEKNSWQELKENTYTIVAIIRTIFSKGGLPEMVTSREYKAKSDLLKARGEYFGERLKSEHATYGPQGKHWYIIVVAVAPDCQGAGLGRELLTRLTTAADEKGMPCYLECGGEKNPSIYEKYGFKTAKAFTVEHPETDLPGSSPVTIYSMVREPKLSAEN